MRDHHTGYKAAAKHFNVPEDEIKAAARATAQQTKPGPGAGNVHEINLPLFDDAYDDADGPDFNPFDEDEETVVKGQISHALRMMRAHAQGGNPNIAHKWNGTYLKAHANLVQIREAKRKEAEARGREGHVDPVQLARRLARQIMTLSKIAPAELEGAMVEALRVMGRTVVPRGEKWKREE